MRNNRSSAGSAGAGNEGVVDRCHGVYYLSRAGDERIEVLNEEHEWINEGGRGGNGYSRRGKARAAGLGIEQTGVGDPRVITLYGNVQVVFERKLNGVL